MNMLKTVIGKELLEISRDRKTLGLTLFMSPLILLVLVFGLGKVVEKKIQTQSDKPLEIAIVGAEHAPNLVKWLAAQGVTAKTVNNPDAAIRAQDEDVYLRISEKFADKWSKGEPAMVEIVHDSTRRDAEIPVRRLDKMLEAYNVQTGSLRLMARGVSPAVAMPVMVARKDLSTSAQRRAMAMMFLPYLLILGGFLGAMAFVIDITAGERERQSLEPLLATPAPRGTLVSGKIIAATVIGMITLLLTCLSFKLGAQLAGGFARMMDVSPMAIVKMLLVLMPIVLVGNALLTLIASGAKSVKEAQSYMTLLMLLPMLPTIFLMVNPVKNQLWMFAVPFLSQNQLLLKILRSETVSPMEWLIYFSAGLGLVALLWLGAVWRYRQEKLAISG
ncbi:ABC transporter permease [Solilutibacter tolerans]|uniref:Sodium transport system permease protein n=1 Tax=Solilutibacter tolerans TaxID=1604334 RepID=A0A1N6RHY5_9GAMM|nr:ABC transporter permease [Lysobacter tolerans]SIQ28306.1 sodium transport system permease protein [Lysobacter tolerans]